MHRQPGYIDGRRFRVGGVPIWGPVPNVPIPGTMEAYGIFDDFLSCEDLDTNESTPTGEATWEFREFTIGTIVQADEVGGAIVIASPATLDNGGQIIMGSAVGGGAFFLAAGKHLWFEARAKATIGSADHFNFYIGLVDPVGADILGDGGGALQNNLLGFAVKDTESNWSSVGRKIAAEDYNGLGEAVDGEYHYFGFYVNGVTNVAVYLDRTLITDGAITTDNIPITGLMPAFAVKAGDGNIEKLTVDYIMCVQLR